MSILEGIVRPFQLSEVTPPKPIPQATSSAQVRNTVINPGHNGSVKTFSGSYNLTVTYYYIKKPKEKQQQA